MVYFTQKRIMEMDYPNITSRSDPSPQSSILNPQSFLGFIKKSSGYLSAQIFIESKLFIYFFTLIISVALSGCTTLFRQPQPFNAKIPWTTRYRQLNRMAHWKIEGALAVKTPQKSFSARFVWNQNSRYDYTIDLFGPLGMNAVKMTGGPELFVLQTASHQTFTARSPEQLIHSKLDWKLPLSNLYFWIRGIPAPTGMTTLTWDSYHHLQSLHQAGWNIEYLEYQKIGNQDLPKRITLQNNLITLRIMISRMDA